MTVAQAANKKINNAFYKMPALTTLNNKLPALQALMYNQYKLKCTEPVAEAESADYSAYTFKMGALTVKYRMAKITPTKTGQFVTLWKRSGKGPIQPFDIADNIDFVIINTDSGKHSGYFIFPKAILCEKGVLSGNNKEGKRAIRVYPPWDHTANKQAQKTQQWQLGFFIEFHDNQPIDHDKLKHLLT